MTSSPMNSNDCSSPRNFSRPFPSPPSSRAFSDEAPRTSSNVEESLHQAQSIQRVVPVLRPAPKKLRKRQFRNVLGEISPKSNPLNETRKPLPFLPAEPESIALTRSLSNNDSSYTRMRAFKGFSSRPPSSEDRRFNNSSSSGRRRLSKDHHPSVKPRHVVSDADLRRETQVTPTLTVSTEDTLEPGGSDKPILHFRAYLWRYLDRDRNTLNLDLFWPQTFEEDHPPELDDSDGDRDSFALEDMRPLIEFRHLKSLKLGGMLVSYQKYIWMACWLNPGLEDLFLEMALEPEIRRECRSLWPKIEQGWEVRRVNEGSTAYL